MRVSEVRYAMKVMIAAPYFHPRVGGLENYAAAIAAGLHGTGWDVVVICGDRHGDKTIRKEFDGYTVWRLPIWKVVSNTPLHPGWPGLIRQIIRSERPDVINAHTPVPYLVDVVTAVAGKIPVVVTYHAASLVKQSGLAMRLVTAGYLAVQAVTLERARGIIAVSPYVKSALGRRWAGKTSVVPNAVASVNSPRTGPGDGLVFVSSLEPSHAWKGLDAILDALATARDRYGISARLTVIGDGADRSRYQRRAADLRLTPSVCFTGRLAGAARDEVMRQAAAQIVYPTTANDGLPTVLLEGWAQGLPVIAAGIGAMTTVVDDGRTGVLAPPADPAALAAAVRGVLRDPAAGQAMGEAARQLVAREYTWPRQVERTDRLLRELTGR
jgi:glycosyltransferase involved in cell wall biosynthesis